LSLLAAGACEMLSAPSSRLEIDGRMHRLVSSSGGESGVRGMPVYAYAVDASSSKCFRLESDVGCAFTSGFRFGRGVSLETGGVRRAGSTASLLVISRERFILDRFSLAGMTQIQRVKCSPQALAGYRFDGCQDL
jgi:hypothetical protein